MAAMMVAVQTTKEKNFGIYVHLHGCNVSPVKGWRMPIVVDLKKTYKNKY
jgi:hypothetical protein